MLLPKECEKLIFSYLGIKYKKKCRATTHLNRICSLKCNNNILCDKHKKILFEKDNILVNVDKSFQNLDINPQDTLQILKNIIVN